MCRKLKEHQALIARHQDAHSRAQEDGKAAEGRLPELKQSLSQADKEAQDAHNEAQRHSDGALRMLKLSLPGRLSALKDAQHHAEAVPLS